MTNTSLSPRRDSSGESYDTSQSDPSRWFDQSNQNPTATFDNPTMDVDPPFFQKDTDSSVEEKYLHSRNAVRPRLATVQSSSADDYRSVIDDLTVEIQTLKEELKRYKQKGPDMLQKDKLFEIKYHGLPGRKKRELETTLRDFTATLNSSPGASSPRRKKSRHTTRENMYSGSGSASKNASSYSKHASSSSGSHPRPVDSAYASMSTGAYSSGTSLSRPSQTSKKSSDQKVESYLRDIPEGLYPRPVVMTDKEKKKLVVRRLEHLFTGKIGGRSIRKNPTAPLGTVTAMPLSTEALAAGHQPQKMLHQPPTLGGIEPAREARILANDQQDKKGESREDLSRSHSNGDQTDSGGNGESGGSTHQSPPNPPPPEQRPTRPKDLDPDRTQVPSENMDYIKHLGLMPPELLTESTRTSNDVLPDADGWVYLNLLCSLAQLHIINVTPSFVRSAVSEVSTQFQLSPDGRKIRWRGGTEGTRFASDTSGNNSHRSPESDDTEGSGKGGEHKRQKTGHSTDGGSSMNPSKFGPQISGSSESFHYKPLFIRQSSHGQTSVEDTMSSFGPVEDSNLGESRWGLSGTGSSNRRKRRHDGAITYYSGAPFCTDLSGDSGDTSPATNMLSNGHSQQQPPPVFARPITIRSDSGSSLPFRPLSHAALYNNKMDVDSDNTPGLVTDKDEDSEELDLDFPWSSEEQIMEVYPLEPCGLGGVLPEDHFMVVVTTKRPKSDTPPTRRGSELSTHNIVARLSAMSASSPAALAPYPTSRGSSPDVDIEYVSGRIRRLNPVPLPPPTIFFSTFSTDSSSEASSSFEDDSGVLDVSADVLSRRANPYISDDYPDNVDLTSGDEDGEDPDDEPETGRMYDDTNDSPEHVFSKHGKAKTQLATSFSSAGAAPGTLRGRSKSQSADVRPATGGSSAATCATAGGVSSSPSSSSDSSGSEST